MRKNLFLLLVIIIVFISPTLFAESTLDRIVVTPNKKPTTIFNTLNSVEVITSEMIKNNGSVSLENILNQSSSISIGSNGGFGQTKSIFMRGTESNHTKVLVNGNELNPGTLGVPSIQHISVDLIEKIEISKGSMSTLYGKNAIGGVINIITKKNQFGEVKYRSGRYSTENITFSDGINYETPASSWSIGGSLEQNQYNLRGHMSNVRIVKGTALYTSNFTAPTSELSAVTNTKLLTLQGDTPFVDNSSSSHTLTVNSAGTNPSTTDTPSNSFLTLNPLATGTTGTLSLGSSISAVKGVGPKQAERLSSLGLVLIRDLLKYFPRDYVDYTSLKTIDKTQAGQNVTIVAKIRRCSSFKSPKNPNLSILELFIKDKTGGMKITKGGALAAKLGWSQSKVSQVRKKITKKVEYYSRGLT